MISGQVDRLRTAAQTYRRLGNHSAESMLLDAADTIWQLRDDLQRANAAVQDAEHDESMAWYRVRKAERDNAKLRERVEKLEELLPENGRWFSTEVVEAYIAEIEKLRELVRDMYEMAYPEYPSAFEAAFADHMRELGVEVDE